MIDNIAVGLNYTVTGSGPDLVFVHGFTTTSGFWRHQIEDLSSEFRVLALDLPGHGDSPADPKYTHDIPYFSRILEDLLDLNGVDKAIVVGLSMGGCVVQDFCLNNPERVRALGLVGTTAKGFGPAVHAENVIARIQEIGMANAAQEVIEKSFSENTPREVIDWARREVSKTPKWVAEQAVRSLDAYDSTSRIHEIKVPTFVAVGNEDAISPPSESEYIHSRLDDSELLVLEGTAHFPMLEKPQAFNHAFRQFLGGRGLI